MLDRDDDDVIRVGVTEVATADGHRLVRVAPVGDLDMYNAGALRDALNEAELRSPERIVVDLTGVAFIDSAGIGVLVGALRRAQERGGAVIAEHATPPVRRVFDTTHLSTAFALDEP